MTIKSMTVPLSCFAATYDQLIKLADAIYI